MSKRAALWLLRISMMQFAIGCAVVATAAQNERAQISATESLDGRVSKLEESRLDFTARIAVLEEMAADIKETRRVTYGIGLTLFLNMIVTHSQFRRSAAGMRD